ncbi:hypothetical protein [Streptomyces celluloflavus]|uniref:hypothetical protein n=1 Tax=Streptomyces celluloflavus TaxID=58344 RepID=UPI0036896ECD
MSAASYRALLCDLRTDQVIDALPAEQVRFEEHIGKTGTASLSIPVTGPAMAARARAAVTPARTAVWIERDGDIWWGGIVWTATITPPSRSGPGAMEVQASTFDSYLSARILTDGWEGEGVDQFDIARQLVDYTQRTPGGDIGIMLDWAQTSGVLRDRAYSRYDLHYVRDLLDQLARVEGGFEWRIRAYRASQGRRTKELQLGHRVIRTGRTEIVLDRPGAVLDYELPVDGTVRATHWISRGATINRDQSTDSYPLMSALFEVKNALAQGWPRLDGSSDYTTVEQQATLDAHAKADLMQAWTSTQAPRVTVMLDGTGLSPHLLGATVRLRIVDEWHPAGHDQRYRLIGMSVSPPGRDSAETAELYLEDPEAAPSEERTRAYIQKGT